MTDFRIRRATANDAGRLARAASQLFAQAFAARNRADDMLEYLATAFGEAQQTRELNDASSLIWIAEAGGPPIGYAHVKLGVAPPSVQMDKPVELARIYADNEWHGRGVGGALLKVCVDASTKWGATSLWLGVWKENPRAIAFYRKHHFQIVGEQMFQLGRDPQHDWIMVRDLEQRTAGPS